MSERDVEVLAFDVFGTVVDWHGSLCREVEKLGLDVPVAEFVTRGVMVISRLCKEFVLVSWGGQR